MRPGVPATTVIPATAVTPPAAMVVATAVVVGMRSASSLSLLMMTQMQEEGQDSSPHEEEDLHDTHSK